MNEKGKYVSCVIGDIVCIVRYTHSMTILEYKSAYNVQLEEVIIVNRSVSNHNPIPGDPAQVWNMQGVDPAGSGCNQDAPEKAWPLDHPQGVHQQLHEGLQDAHWSTGPGGERGRSKGELEQRGAADRKHLGKP